MADENKWPLSRKISLIVIILIIVGNIYYFYFGEINYREGFRDYLKFGLPAFVCYIIYQRNKAKKKRQEEQEADAKKAFREKHGTQSSE